MYSLMFALIKLLFVGSLCIIPIHYWITNKSYLFSDKIIEEIALRHKDSNAVQVAYDRIYLELSDKFPGHILGKDDQQWVFMNCGGWMGSVNIIHASLTEYILFFGTAINTSGNSGRYYANISDTILVGSFRQWQEGELTSQMFGPGDTVYHYWGEAAAVEWTAGTWMVEYGRGFIPSTLGFALADTLFSTQDFITLYYILKIYSKALLMELSTYLFSEAAYT